MVIALEDARTNRKEPKSFASALDIGKFGEDVAISFSEVLLGLFVFAHMGRIVRSESGIETVSRLSEIWSHSVNDCFSLPVSRWYVCRLALVGLVTA